MIPPDKKALALKFRKDTLVDIAIIGCVSVVLSGLMARFDIFELWHNFVHMHDEWDLNEVLVVVLSMLVAGTVLAVRHTIRLEKMNDQLEEMQGRLETEQDIKNQNEKLASIGEIAGGMAHEINNALQPAIGMSEILIRRLKDQDPKLTEYVTMIHDSSLQARNIVQNVLSFARGKYMDMHFVTVEEALNEALALSKPMVSATVDLTIDLGNVNAPAQTPYLLINETGLSQIFSNLFKNASDAMGQNGTIDVSLKYKIIDESLSKAHDVKPGPFVEITVRDDGPGMNKEILDKIFDPFFTTKPVDQGTGLGLATSFGIMRQFGGTIYAESKPREGASFYILLPVLKEEERPQDLPEEDLFLD